MLDDEFGVCFGDDDGEVDVVYFGCYFLGE